MINGRARHPKISGFSWKGTLNLDSDWMGMPTISLREASKKGMQTTDTVVNYTVVRRIVCERVALVDKLTNHAAHVVTW